MEQETRYTQEEMSTNKKLEALHANLKGTYELPDYDTFAKDLTDTVKSKAFFETLSNDGFDMPPDYDTFVSDLGLKKKEPGEFGLPSKDVISQMFGNIAKDSLPVSTKPSEEELSQEVATDPKQFDTPDLSLESPEFKGPEQNNLSDAVSRITYESIGKINFKEQVTNRISDIDKEIAALPQDNTEMLPSMNFSGGLILPTRPVSDEKARLLKEKDDLKLAITTPSKLDYVLGKAYNQTIVGLADAIINGEPRANEEWLSKYDSNTLTDVTATALSFLGDSWFFGGMGKVGGSIGKAAAKPIVNKMMTKGVEKLVTSGIEEKLAKELVLKGAARITQGAMSMSSSGTALGSYSAVGDALGQWSQPDANFDDIKFSQSLSAGLKSTVLGIGVGGIGLASAAVASKASAIPGTAARVGAKVGVAAGGLTAESALFAGGGAAMEGEPLTMQAFSETVLLLAMLKGQRLIGKVPEIVTDPKKAAVKLYKSLQYDPKKPGEGQFEVDIKPWELEAIGAKEYKETMDILSKDDKVLADILNSEKVPALLKQKLLWGSRGVGMEDVNLLADKVVQNGEMTELYNKEGLLVDVQKARSPAEAQQDAMETGLQLEDNKMRTQAASLPVEDKIGVSKKLKEKGIDEAKLLAAVDKPVNERTPEESKMVGDYWSMIPKKEIKPEENPFTKEEVSTPEDIAKELEVDYKGVQKNEEGEPSLDLYNVKVGKESEATFAVKSGATKEEVLAKRDETTAKWKPEKPAVEETPAEVKKETVKTVEKKLDRQKIVKDDKIFKEQKNQLIDDLTAAEDILLGKNKDFAREKESEMPPDLKDSLMKTNYEHEDLNNLPPDVIKKLNKLGIRVKDGNLIVDIYKDGSLEVGDIRTALGIVKKGFPAKTPAIKTGVSGPTNPKAREFRTVAESYGSLSEAERRVKVAEENLSQSKQEGRTKKVGDKTVPIEVNKKLVATMQEQLTLAKSIHEEAKNVGEEGYNRIAKQKKMDADKEFGAFWDEFKDHFGYNDVRREQVYDAIEKQGRPKDLTYDTVQPLVMKEALGVEKKTIEQKRSDIEQRLVKNELELKDKYGRKDGGGLRKPKNNREEWEQRTLNNAIEKDRSNLIDLEKYEPAIKKLNEEKTIDKPDSTEGTGKGDKLPPSAKGDKAGVTDKGEAKPSEEVKSEVKKEPSKEQGVKFKDKNYQSVDAVLDAIDKGEITFDESKQLREDVAKFEEGLKAEAKKNSEKIAGKIKISTGEAETDIKKNAEDQGKLRMRFLPPDIISRGNTALWKQLIKPRDAIADWIAGKLQQGGQSQIDALRWTSKTVTNWFGGLGRTERDILGKLRMSGTVKEFAPYEASQVSKQLLKIVNSDPESLRRVRDALDPEIATEKLVYGDLTVAEKNLYSQLRELNTWVHETNYANGFIDSETYLKFKDVTGDSKYIARMYDVYTLPKEVADMVNNNRTKKKTNALELDMFKAREEVDEWKKDHAITDPVYLTTKRVMQTIQNAAVKEYMVRNVCS